MVRRCQVPGNLTPKWAAGALALAALLLLSTAASAAPGYTITVNIAPNSDAGYVLPDTSTKLYQKNNIVQLTATANSGYVFKEWTGAVTGTSPTVTLRVSGNANVTAKFTLIGGGGGGGTAQQPLPTTKMLVGYFAQWTIYQRGYLVRDVQKSGTAAQLNVINYAFAAPDSSLKCVSLDTFADWNKAFSASESVDGVADVYSQPLKGNFNQLLKLKKLNPNLRVVLSLGGWTQSTYFSKAARDENRAAFVTSCISLFMEGTNAGVFDGFDIDWEYPGTAGATNNFDATNDPPNFTALLQEFRHQLDDLEDKAFTNTGTRPEYLLTVAVPAGAAHYAPLDIAAMAAVVDWVNVMAYDFHGPWETQGPARAHAGLFPSSCGTETDWGDKAIRYYLDHDVPASKLLLGVPFYGHGWKGVAAVGNGDCQPATGIARGKYENGTNDYKLLDAQGRPEFYNATVVTHWSFNGTEFWSYDDTDSLARKATYVNTFATPLRGIMFWELSGDGADGRLVTALRDVLK